MIQYRGGSGGQGLLKAAQGPPQAG